jgi:hypothetical protein
MSYDKRRPMCVVSLLIGSVHTHLSIDRELNVAHGTTWSIPKEPEQRCLHVTRDWIETRSVAESLDGHQVNLPVEPQGGKVTQDAWFLEWKKVVKSVELFRPNLIIISAGFDAHKNDPIGVGDDAVGGLLVSGLVP